VEGVPNDAIQKYVTTLGELMFIPSHVRTYFAYLFGVEGVGGARYKRIARMPYADFREAIRIVGGENNISTLLQVIPTPSDLEQEIDVPDIFSEYASAKDLSFNGKFFSSPYCQLLKLPCRARTFFAGLLFNAPDAPNMSLPQNYSPEITLPVSTKGVLEYAASLKIKDPLYYLKLISKVQS
jgi:hypothetical protein